MKRLYVLAAVAAVVMGLAAGPAWGNDSELGVVAGDVMPIDNRTVRMDSEAVQVSCLEDFALYRVDFKFVNESDKTQPVRLGFPFMDYSNKPWSEWASGQPARGFRAWFNGREIKVTPVKGKQSADYPDAPVTWFAHDVRFPPGASMVTVFYVGDPGGSVPMGVFEGLDLPGGAKDAPVGWYPYQVSTGAGWKGRIGTSVIRYTFAPSFDMGLVVAGTQRRARSVAHEEGSSAEPIWVRKLQQPSPGVLQWTYRDYEPTQGHDPFVVFPQLDPYSDESRPSPGARASSTWADSEADWTPLGWDYLGWEDYVGWQYLAAGGDPGSYQYAWAEGADGPGVGEWLECDFGTSSTVHEMRIAPGEQYDPAAFAEGNRPKKVRVDFSDGTSLVVELADEMGVQFFETEATATSAKVTILEVYPGTAQEDVTYFSDITFAEQPAPRFTTFKALTGIDPPADFREPAALRPLTSYPDGSAAFGPASPSGTSTSSAVPTVAVAEIAPASSDDPAGRWAVPAVLLIAAAACAAVAYLVIQRRSGPVQPAEPGSS